MKSVKCWWQDENYRASQAVPLLQNLSLLDSFISTEDVKTTNFSKISPIHQNTVGTAVILEGSSHANDDVKCFFEKLKNVK